MDYSLPLLLRRCGSCCRSVAAVSGDGWGWGGSGGAKGGVMESMHIFKLRSFLISYFQTRHCVFTAAGPHCQLSLSRLQIEIDLPDREPPARGRTLSDGEELPVRRVCHLEPRRLFIYSSKDSLMWGWRGDALHDAEFWAPGDDRRHQPVMVVWFCGGHASVCRVPPPPQQQHYFMLFSPLHSLCSNVLTELYIPVTPLQHPVRARVKYWHSL